MGKSAIAARWNTGQFNDQIKETVGVDFSFKTLARPGYKEVKLQLWDTGKPIMVLNEDVLSIIPGGQEKFRAISTTYFRYCSVAVLVYDPTNRETFTRLGLGFGYTQEFG